MILLPELFFMDPKDKHIFITGATGFVGSYIVRTLLSNGYKNITGLHRSSSSFDLLGSDKDNIEWVEGDICDQMGMIEALEGVEILIHTAAMISLRSNQKAKMNQINVGGTANLVDAALVQKVSRFIHFSSVEALGSGIVGRVIDENTEWNEKAESSSYGMSKMYAEREVFRGKAEGLNIIILNPGFILGAGHWNEGPTKLPKIIFNKMPYYSNGSMGVVDVRDVANFAVHSITKDRLLGGRTILVAENISFKDLTAKFAQHLGVPLPKKSLSPFLGSVAIIASAVQSIFNGNEPLITKESLRIANFPFRFDGTKSKAMFGAAYIPLNQTIADVSKCFASTFPKGMSFGVLDTL